MEPCGRGRSGSSAALGSLRGAQRGLPGLQGSMGNGGGAHRTQELGVPNHPPPLFPFSQVQIFPRGGNCSKLKMSGGKSERCRRQASSGRERGEGRRGEERAAEMSDEPPGINQTSLKGSTQPCCAPLSKQGFLPARKGTKPQLSIPVSHSCPTAPLPALLQTPRGPGWNGVSPCPCPCPCPLCLWLKPGGRSPPPLCLSWEPPRSLGSHGAGWHGAGGRCGARRAGGIRGRAESEGTQGRGHGGDLAEGSLGFRTRGEPRAGTRSSAAPLSQPMPGCRQSPPDTPIEPPLLPPGCPKGRQGMWVGGLWPGALCAGTPQTPIGLSSWLCQGWVDVGGFVLPKSPLLGQVLPWGKLGRRDACQAWWLPDA